MKKLFIAFAVLTINCISAQEYGKATFYHDKYEGRKTTSGEKFYQTKLTCAAGSKWKLGDRLKLTNPKTGASVECKVNDRGVPNGVFDLSKKAFKILDHLSKGTIEILIEKI